MRRICVFCETWESGGIESFLTSILTNLDKSCMEIDIVAACVKKSIFTTQLMEDGICLYELSGNRNCMLDNKKMFLKILKERHYDVIHLNVFHGASLYYLSLARKMGIPIRIAHSHNVALRRGRFYFLKLMVHKWTSWYYVTNATDLWACSNAAADFMFPRSKRKLIPFRIVPNGFDTKKFKFSETMRDKIRERLGMTNQILVGHIGRLCYQKNQVFLLHVFAELLAVLPDSKLLLVGEGEDRAKLETEAALLQIKDKIVFWGLTDHTEQLLWAMDAFVFPSVFEGLGIAAVEAQAAGLPVICSDQIPDEACILQSVKRLPLNAGLGKWVKAIEDSQSMKPCREESVSIVKKSGFDIADVVRLVEQTYFK